MEYGATTMDNGQRANRNMASPIADRQIAAVPMRFSEQGKVINELGQAITELEKRLTSVLSPLPPSTGEGCGSAPCGSNVSDRIGDNTRSLDMLRSLVVQMLDRLEL